MKIVDKQTLRIPIVLGLVLVAFSINIFLFFSYFRENEFYNYLQSSAINRSRLIFDAGVKPSQLNVVDIDLKETSYIQKQYVIYDSSGTVLYKSKNAVPHLTEERKREVFKKVIEFKKDGYERVLFTNRENAHNTTYIIEAAGYDMYGFNKQKTLINILISSCLSLIILVILITRFYIKKDLLPIGNIADRMRRISTKNLQQRIPEATIQNEIGQMAQTFNELLDRLDASYKQQHNFVSYVTHELRTPLSILLGNAQVTLMKERSTEEYKQTIHLFQDDTNSMISLVNTLLELARMNAESQAIAFTDVRIDEVLWSAADILRQKKPNYQINIDFEEMPDSADAIIVNGNTELLMLVFRNLMENGCKYSPKNQVNVIIKFTERSVLVHFEDQGIGISETEIDHIFEAFYRTSKAQEHAGHGVGLPLSKRIIEIHSGTISVKSCEGKGATFIIELPIKEVA